MNNVTITRNGERIVDVECADGLLIRMLASLVSSVDTSPAETEEKEPIQDEDHYPRKYTKRKNGKRHCKKCGKAGHRSDGCPAIVGQSISDDDDNDLEVTDDIKKEINEMLAEGKGSKEIADYYGVSVKNANHAIAKVKGITLP